MNALGAGPEPHELWAALATVRDPELDEPITELGFVGSAELRDGHASVRLRLPTYFCAPNFAYLMVADALDAVRAAPGVTSAEVRLVDHFAAEEINAGAALGGGFAGAFPGEASGELDGLRLTFRRKAYLAGLDRVVRRWGRLARLGEVPDGPELAGLVRRRAELGLDCSPGSPLLLDERGRPIPEEEAERRLRFARTVRVSIEGNAGLCRGLLRTRYGD
ncbi:iron-sulfur cluster assembly protein [Nonomuraea monospora]|uniref:Iron-sulfur cluster assembly protein n=1 Tax=Nonomuraea monospora TaxID=568818 RepID=A0ABN3CJM0_9ACTN